MTDAIANTLEIMNRDTGLEMLYSEKMKWLFLGFGRRGESGRWPLSNSKPVRKENRRNGAHNTAW
jgi:hypothetical protein